MTKHCWLSSQGLMAIGIVGLLCIGTLAGGCGGGGTMTPSPSVTRDVPQELFGQWLLVRTSGGITGEGYPVTPTTETVTFNNNGSCIRTVNGETIQGTFRVEHRKTLFSTNHQPVILYNNSGLNDIISEVGNYSLSLNEEAADGYTRKYERVKRTGL